MGNWSKISDRPRPAKFSIALNVEGEIPSSVQVKPVRFQVGKKKTRSKGLAKMLKKVVFR